MALHRPQLRGGQGAPAGRWLEALLGVWSWMALLAMYRNMVDGADEAYKAAQEIQDEDSPAQDPRRAWAELDRLFLQHSTAHRRVNLPQKEFVCLAYVVYCMLLPLSEC